MDWLRNLWRGIMRVLVTKSAEAAPEVTIGGMIAKRKAQRKDIINKASKVRGLLKSTRSRHKAKNAELQKLKRALQNAIAEGNKKAGSVIIQQVKILEELVNDLAQDVKELAAVDKQLVSDIKVFNQKILDMQSKLKVKSARASNARTQREVMDQVSGLAIEWDSEAEQAAWDKFDADIGAAEIVAETDGAQLEREVRQLVQDAEVDAAGDEFDTLRAEFEASQGVSEAASGDNSSKSA